MKKKYQKASTTTNANMFSAALCGGLAASVISSISTTEKSRSEQLSDFAEVFDKWTYAEKQSAVRYLNCVISCREAMDAFKRKDN